MYKINLQLFAEGEVEEKKEEATPEVKTYTEEELDKLVQAEADRRVTKGLETARTKWEEEHKKKVEKEKELAQLSAEERLKKELAEKEKSLADQEKSLNVERLKFQAGQELLKKNLPTEFLDFVIAETSEKTFENLNILERSWAEAIDKAIKERLKGRTPEMVQGKGKSQLESLQESLAKATKLEEKMMIKRRIDELNKQEG